MTQLPPIGDSSVVQMTSGSSKSSPRLGVSSDDRPSSSVDGLSLTSDDHEQAAVNNNRRELLLKSLDQLK